MPRVRKFIREIDRLSEMEQDPVVRDFFSTLLADSVIKETRNIVRDVSENRANITTEHLPYLLFISLQYIKRFKYDSPQPEDEVLHDLATNRSEIVQLCLERNSSTNVINRYSHLQITLEMMNREVSVLDIGTAMGMGLMALNTEYVTNVDTIPHLRNYLTASARISSRVGIDTQPRDTQWMVSCYLPEQKEERRNAIARYDKLQDKNPIKFEQIDLFDLPNDRIPKVDIAWTSSMRYQAAADLNSVHSAIDSQLSDEGFWIDLDYRDIHKPFTHNDNPYVTRIFTDLGEEPIEALQSPNDNAKTVSPGSDFGDFCEICQ